MTSPLESYALIGDTHTAALVGRDGSVDWLCLPRFDSGACFSALLGDSTNGRWILAPAPSHRDVASRRRYRGNTLILESEFVTATGTAQVIDFMPPRGAHPHLVRIVQGTRGRVDMEMNLTLRFDYGHIVPWVRSAGADLLAVAGADAVVLRTPVETTGVDLHTVASFSVAAGERVPFVLSWHPSNERPPKGLDADRALAETERYWEDWVARSRLVDGPWRDEVLRSLLTLKALTYAPTGGVVAAPTTSLPEQLGGSRNWDYRYCWLRDASLTLGALLGAGYREEAVAWRDWLLRAVAGSPSEVQIMYGLSGERRLTEVELPWLRGYEGSVPVRVGNGAHSQFQLDVYGEVTEALFHARQAGVEEDENAWRLQQALLEHLEGCWQLADEGIWEVRGEKRLFTFSRVMAWVAFDRMIRTVEARAERAPGGATLDRWRAVRRHIHEEVCDRGFDRGVGAFMQYYGAPTLDASLLQIPLVGFLPVDDTRVASTVRAIEARLVHDGLVDRYDSDEGVDGLPPGEGTFLACTFWLADCQAELGRNEDAVATFERVLALRNDVGLLSEEYDVSAGRLVGNYPQAFSHIGLINTANRLAGGGRGRAVT